jgi:pimeloyl-ACP methyl ester carboxylesterase
MTIAITIVVAALLVIALGLLGTGIALARRVVAYRPPRLISYSQSEQDLRDGTITLPRSIDTTAPGRYGLWDQGRDGHMVIGDITREDGEHVTRTVVSTAGAALGNTGHGAYGGHVYTDPRQFGQCDDVEISTKHGPIKLWKIVPPTANPTDEHVWAIHIHGIRSTREGVLRTLPAATRAGLTSLVMSFAGEEQSKDRPGVDSSLGIREWHDVDAVVGYALEAGASSVVLVAWSMGASAALLAAERSAHRDRFDRLVLIDPATDWREIIRHAARQAHAPRILADLACGVLTAPWLHRTAGSPARIDFDELDWTTKKRLNIPTLVIHSRGDGLVPFQLSPAFVKAQEPCAELVTFDAVPHCAEYNAEPEKFDDTIAPWLVRPLKTVDK